MKGVGSGKGRIRQGGAGFARGRAIERWGDILVDGKALGSGKKWELEWSFAGNVKAETQTQQREMPLLGKQENRMQEMAWN